MNKPRPIYFKGNGIQTIQCTTWEDATCKKIPCVKGDFLLTQPENMEALAEYLLKAAKWSREVAAKHPRQYGQNSFANTLPVERLEC